MTDTYRLPREEEPGESQDHDLAAEDGTLEGRVPFLPGWISAGGWLPLVVIAIIVVFLCVKAGTAYGAADGWALLLALAVPPVCWLWRGFIRRGEASELARRQELRARIKIREIDHMSWQEFEMQCITLLQLLGHENVVKTSNRRDEKSVDIIATDPGTGKGAVYECKHRQRAAIHVDVVNELIGRVSSGMYKGMPVTLMTNARVGDGARRRAAEHGIRVIGREELAGLIGQALYAPGDRVPGQEAGASPDGQVARASADVGGHIISWFLGLRLETQLAVAATGVGALVILIVVLQVAITGPRAVAAPTAVSKPSPAAAQSSGAAHSRPRPATTGRAATPDAVVRAFFSAISAHDWPEVWQLGGKDIGRGQYATYPGMISGYRETIRDVPLTMTSAGDTVSGRFLAYETGNRIQTYTFTYVIRDGAIVHAAQHVMAATG